MKPDKRSKTSASTASQSALEKTRLHEELQRLRNEVEQRNTELALINSVQQALASQLDMQAIYDLVGDKMRELFDAQCVWIVTIDPATRTRRIKYGFENGERIHLSETLPSNKLADHMIVTKKPVLINQVTEDLMAKFGFVLIPGTEPMKSGVFVPLLANGEAKGILSLQNIKREDAFSESDVNLLSTFTSAMQITLENIRLFEETQRLLKETEERNAELAVINSVQLALAAQLDMQGIYDAVGDKIREIFDAQGMFGVFIVTLDYENRQGIFNYFDEKGERYYFPGPVPFSGLMEHIATTGEMVVINENMLEGMKKYRMRFVGGQLAPSGVWMPFKVGNIVRGIIALQNLERENAFSESDIRLLQTLANSMSIAIENARLFDETQRLLKETEQRAQELAIINSVQAGLASKLDMQAIFDLVGDKIRELFDAQSILIVMFDQVAGTRQIKYHFENGNRHYVFESFPFNKLTMHLIATKKALVINRDVESFATEFEMIVAPGTAAMKSGIFVPLLAGEEVSGFISIQNVEREDAFSTSDVNLLSTFASSMSVALENARLYEEQLGVSEELKRVDRMKTQFLSSMSHELRTPLNAIINFVEMMARGMIGPVNPEQEELLNQTLDSSKHLLHLINDVLDISKIQAGRLTLFLEEQVNLYEELEGVLNTVSGLSQEKGLQLIQDIDPHLPMIRCDRRRVRQVLLNLLGNAIKFTDVGTVTLSAKKRDREIRFAVIDTGPGIPQAEQELIFEPFLQGADGEKKIQGTGLGLPISRSLVRAHGGELWVESEPGEGAALFFTLPVHEPR